MSITPEDIEAGTKIADALLQVGKWVGGTVAAAWIAVKWIFRAGGKYQQNQDLDERVSKLEQANYLTRPQHDDMQRMCQGEIERMIDAKLHKTILEWRDEMAALNANVCHIMGALNIRPVDQGKRRRATDLDDGDWAGR